MYGAWAPLIGLKDVWRSFNLVSSVLAEDFFMGGGGVVVQSNLVSSVLAGAIDTGVLGLLSPGGFGLR